MSTQDSSPVDFSHPDIMIARAKVYALLLQWRKERAGYTRTQGEQRKANQPESNQEASRLDISGILQATEEGPSSA